MKNIRLILLIAALILAAGCKEYEQPTPGFSQDTGQNDVIDATSDIEEMDAEDVQDIGDQEDAETDVEDVPTCEPIAVQCSEETCGEQPDGCGGTISCLPCGCTLTEDTCEIAGLGILMKCTDPTNSSEETLECISPEFPLAAWGEEPMLLYVNLELDADERLGDGTKDLPLKTIPEAIIQAQKANNIVAIIIAGGNDTEFQSTPITLGDGISLLAGYDSQFKYNPNIRPTIHISSNSISNRADFFGLKAETITRPTLIHGLQIKTQDATSGLSNYAVYAHNIEPETLKLHNITATAGRGGNGSNGQNGATGNSGDNGQESKWVPKGILGPFTPESSTPGQGGNNSSCPGIDTEGGIGGQGEKKSTPAKPGSSVPKANGGLAGIEGSNNGRGGDGDSAPPNTEHGLAGTAGASGGNIVDTLWHATGDGASAENGNDGYGGGGGGGAIFANGSSEAGQSGAGGGAGGCGGQGGQGGQGGGGSFGLFLVDAKIEIKNSSFTASAGGTGGNGGNGGEGGLGSEGGISANNPVQPGGNGGKGSAGAPGGQGGGGAGGVSYGAYCHESSVLREDEAPVTFTKGSRAPGGQGGNPGRPGIAEDSFGCE